MGREQPRNFLFAAACLMIAGCATVHPRPDYDRAAARITGATGQAKVYQPGDEEVCAARVDELLEGGITAGKAVQICLLNNPSLQAAFMDIGVARADLVQAGLLSNPSLSASLRLPSGGGLANVEAGLAQNIADLWQIPPRKRAAERSLDRTILDLARHAASLAAEAKAAYFQAVGAQERHAIAQQNLSVAKTLLDLAQARQQAGAATELDTNLSRSSVLQAELIVESDRLTAADGRRTLATLLGLTSNADSLVLLDPLPEVPSTLPDVEQLVEAAMSSRLDLRAADLEALERSVSQEVRGAVDKLRTAWKVAQVYRDRSIPLAQSNLDLSRDAYQAGRASFLTVLEAQRVFLDSRARYVDAAQTAASSLPELERTVGLPFRELVSTVPAGPSQDSAENQPLERSPQ